MLRESTRMPSRQRRGVVLVLILGMLALMSLIGVSFATFSGQTQRAARVFSEKFLRPNPQDLVDYALSQLINDTDNPMSAIRGHSLKRDMYGSDGNANGFLQFNPVTRLPIQITNVAVDGADNTRILTTDLPNVSISSYGYNFLRWTIRLMPASAAPPQVPQTFEVLQDLGWNPALGLRLTSGFVQLRIVPATTDSAGNPLPPIQAVNGNSPFLAAVQPNQSIILDGRYLRAFNGAGISTLDGVLNNSYQYPPDLSNLAATTPDLAGRHPNFRYNGLYFDATAGFSWYNRTLGTVGAIGNPDSVGADEDYDAPDLENWFLALQSADGQVVIPSFHRPSTLFHNTADPSNANTSDWLKYSMKSFGPASVIPPTAFQVWSKFLRPRKIDHSWDLPDPTPDPTTGKIEYDVDNDGDGVREGVWLDLGYAPQHDTSTGRLYKPLFSFTVIGLNGKIPLNTAGNIQGRRLTTDGTALAGDPTWNHTSHLGYSVSEINPLFALQATYNPTPAASAFNNIGVDGEGLPTLLPALDPATNRPPAGYYSQTDSRRVPVNITQLRNLLSGTRPQADPIKPSDPMAGPLFGIGAFWTSQFASNSEKDFVNVGLVGQAHFMPNSIPNVGDSIFNATFGSAENDVEGSNVAAIRNSEPVAGRWGESFGVPSLLPYGPPAAVPPYALWNNPVRAGISVSPNPNYKFLDGTDDDYTARDINGELANDLYDVTGSNLVPSERIRRYATPIDLAGVGRVIAHDWDGFLRVNAGGTSTLSPYASWGTGQDVYGRVGHFMYFRPPGVPLEPGYSGVLIPPHMPNTRNNPTHGYEASRNPSGKPSAGTWHSADYHVQVNQKYMTGGPTDVTMPGGSTFGMDVNSRPNTAPWNVYTTAGPANFVGPYDPTLIANGMPLGSLGKDDAAEMNLYGPSSYDQPFNFRDLDWLYNRDPDITSNPSRLAQLAPISLDAPTTGLIPEVFDSKERRSLFTTEIWDLNRYSFAPDNPSNAFPLNNRQLPFNATIRSFWSNGGLGYQNPTTPSFYPPAYRSVLAPLAHGDRRINLNFPLPVSSKPFEPVRQKWIFNTYQMLKEILPPGAVDTPQELAQLSQFVVNIVDFRDSDGGVTIFDNPDLTMKSDPTTNVKFAAVRTNAAVEPPLRQYGMEYLPIAINEVLAFSYRRRDSSDDVASGLATSRLFIELVNTLTQPNGADPSCDLNLLGWDLLVHADNDDWDRRPDPITGSVQPVTDSTGKHLALKFGAFTPVAPDLAAYEAEVIGAPGTPFDPVKALALPTGTIVSPTDDDRYFYVLANDRDGAPTGGGPDEIEQGTPPVAPDLRPNVRIPKAFVTGALEEAPLALHQKRWHWAVLRRLADPLDVYGPNNPYVVVDSMRFPFVEGSTTTPSDSPGGVPNDAEEIWSASRRQPFVGGQVIYDHTTDEQNPVGTLNPAVPRPRHAYGFTEQTRPTNTASTLQARWGPVGGSGYKYLTKPAYHTIGKLNNTGSVDNQPWRQFVFHDRDFTGVGELLLVPGCSPGLFTKQFAEQMYKPDATSRPFPEYFATPPTRADARARSASALGNGVVAHPYLPEQFYYTGASPVAVAAANSTVPSLEYVTGAGTPYLPQIGGVTGGGWHKMLEFFEVPSTMFGAIGPVSQGENFDWFRQDRVPGKVNLNLIIDEEVFFGLVDDPRLDTRSLLAFNRAAPPASVSDWPPIVASGLLPTLAPTYYEYNRGYLKIEGNPGAFYPSTTMKVAFSDFLKLRHGGSGYIFAFGAGAVGSGVVGTTPPTPIAAERPYRSLSFPDIDYTIMRPAGLPPSNLTSTAATQPLPPGLLPVSLPPGILFCGDPGVRNPYLEWANFPTGNPPIPLLTPVAPRRLFQIPDYYLDMSVSPDTVTRNAASERGNTDINVPINHGLSIAPAVGMSLKNPHANLFGSDLSKPYGAGDGVPDETGYFDTVTNKWRCTYFLGGLTMPLGPSGTIPPGASVPTTFGYDPDCDPNVYPAIDDPNADNSKADLRRQPLYRTELLQKVMNLTTVRTHQFAVWITVGFFEVTKAGTASTLEPDTLGPELVQSNGKTQRYRSFFVIDRTRATGFNPTNPGDYNELVVYRRSIE